MQVNAASGSDLRPLLDLMVEFHVDNGVFPLSPAKVVAYLQETLARGVVLIARDGDRLVGTMGLAPGEVWYAESVFLEERWLFVHPDARRSTALLRMLRRAIRIADDKGWPMVASVITMKALERKGDLFKRLGFAEAGRVFLRQAAEG